MYAYEEKAILYSLMREIIAERRELSKQYYDLKYRLNELENENTNDLTQFSEKQVLDKNFNEKIRVVSFPKTLTI